jgi:pimeloyl-ACP methyl ester carboxylesterase
MAPAPRALSLATPGGTLAAVAHGPEDGVPVLALHGWLDNAASFERLAPLLPPEVQLVALDMPGHGLSDHHPPGFLYGFVDMVAAVHHAVQALGWERFGLVGHSLGAAVAATLAGAFPDAVQRLVLLEGLGPLTTPAEAFPQRLRDALADETRRRDRRPPVYPDVEHAAQRWAEAARVTIDSARILCARGCVEVELPDGTRGVTWRSDPRLRVGSRLRLTEEQVLASLSAITCPTLLVRARDGFDFAPEVMRRRRAALRDATLLEIDGGHHAHLDAPVPQIGAGLKFEISAAT